MSLHACTIAFLFARTPPTHRFFSMCLPKGQEAELAGFFVYCTQILAWLPPLIFSLLVDANVPQKYGVIASSFGFVVGILFLSCTASWEEIVAEADQNKDLDLIVDDNSGVAVQDEVIHQGPGIDSRPTHQGSWVVDEQVVTT